ncbi:hypothetical protein ACFO4N_13875 [Camelliibacillus cellulosilyticus]|uniref:Uncharacterized protein n=1 Tax=Camelliibacillus cellulosilyticus TaxID=2174486 RepID=A0ABV9GNN8_9BACL
MNRSYAMAFPLVPISWLLIEMYDRYIHHLSYESYKIAIWFMVTGIIILQAALILVFKRRY